MKFLIAVLCLLISLPTLGQGFITGLEQDDFTFLFGNACTVTLESGETVEGTLTGGSIVSGYLNNITIKGKDGEKLKYKPEDVSKLTIKTSKIAKLAMIAESTSSIKEATSTDFNEIVNRNQFIFETAMRHNKNEKLRLMQLLNPGFDSKIKVYDDPNAKETMGVGIGGIKLTGGVDKSYLLVQNDEKAVRVKKGNYKKDFDELYKNCPKMLQIFAGEKVKWEDVAGHVFVYDQACK